MTRYSASRGILYQAPPAPAGDSSAPSPAADDASEDEPAAESATAEAEANADD